jgi:DNA-binding beta-propeller fold protein YncE
MVLTPEEAFLYVANNDSSSHSVSVIEVGSWRTVVPPVDVGMGANLNPTSLAVTSDGRKVFVALQDPASINLTVQKRSDVCVINTATNTVTAVIDANIAGAPVNNWPDSPGRGLVGELAIRPRSPLLYAPIMRANRIAVIDTEKDCVLRDFPAGSGPWLAFAPDGEHFYEVCTQNLGLAVFKTAGDSRELNFFPSQCATPECVAVTPDSKRLYVTCVGSGNLSVIDASDAAYPVIHTIQLPWRPPAPVGISPDGSEVWAMGGGDKPELVVIETKNNSESIRKSIPDAGPARVIFGSKIY